MFVENKSLNLKKRDAASLEWSCQIQRLDKRLFTFLCVIPVTCGQTLTELMMKEDICGLHTEEFRWLYASLKFMFLLQSWPNLKSTRVWSNPVLNKQIHF